MALAAIPGNPVQEGFEGVNFGRSGARIGEV
jgi:hypothetical protein